MGRSSRAAALGVALALAASAAASVARADATTLPAPSSTVPSYAGTGLSSAWATGTPSELTDLDRALQLLTPGSLTVGGVGPVSLSNFLAPIGDFDAHAPMPYSPTGSPQGPGPYVVARMAGAWAIRAPGTYAIAIGSDDGFRVTLGGVVVLEHAPAQPFRHASATIVAAEAGLYPLVVEYFNGVQEGVVELSVASGDVGRVAADEPLPSAFALIAREDLYPLDGDVVGPSDAGVASDAGRDDDAGDDAASPGATPGSIGAPGAANDDAIGGDGAAWHGGGCRVARGHGDATPFALLLAFLVASRARARRQRG